MEKVKGVAGVILHRHKRKLTMKKKLNNSIDEMKESLKRLPVQTLVQSIGVMIEILEEQGKIIRDWDQKDRIMRMVKIIGGEIYILEEKELKVVNAYDDHLKAARQQVVAMKRLCKDLQRECDELRKKLERKTAAGSSGARIGLRG